MTSTSGMQSTSSSTFVENVYTCTAVSISSRSDVKVRATQSPVSSPCSPESN